MGRSGHFQNPVISRAYPCSLAAIKVSTRSLLSDPNKDFIRVPLTIRFCSETERKGAGQARENGISAAIWPANATKHAFFAAGRSKKGIFRGAH
jgi:hypothetical protein